MKREIIITSDGSHTLLVPELQVTYHSHHGAIQESMHVFIDAGLQYTFEHELQQPLHIFEMGFGTGLNAFLTALEAKKKGVQIFYMAIEPYPLPIEEALQMNYADNLGNRILFENLHRCAWNEEVMLTENFIFRKEQTNLHDFSPSGLFHLIYFDAFAPAVQPELWSEETFQKLFNMLLPGGILVTYCSKSDVRRAMKAAGFIVEKISGPRGKREMVRATSPRPSPEGGGAQTT